MRLGKINLMLCSVALLGGTVSVREARAASTQPLPPPTICVNSSCANTAQAAAVGAGVKWHPGNYAQSGNIVLGGGAGPSLSTIEAEIDSDLSGNPNVLGYMSVFQWDALEDSQGVYLFSMMDSIRSYIATKYPGKRYAVNIWVVNYFGTSCTNIVPSYILNSSAYGPGNSGTQYGYWELGSPLNSCTAALWRQSVVTRLEALWAALAAHPSPYSTGYTYDTDPYFEAVATNETALSINSSAAPPDFPSGGSNLTNYETLYDQLISSMVQSFPHTNVVAQNNWLPFGGASDAIVVTNATSAAGAAQGGPDITYPIPSNASYGQLAYIGATSGSTSYVGKVPYIASVQWPDYPGNGQSATMSQIFTTATANPNSGFMASEIWWQSSWQWTATVLPFINSNPIPSSNATCPTYYTSLRGGCNTN